MPKVIVRPLDIVLEAPEGETIMDAARAAGYYWPTTCGGEGRCTTCLCTVIDGLDHLSPRGRAESKVLVEERGPAVLEKPLRLACQARVYGDVEVEKTGVRPPMQASASSPAVGEGPA